MANALAPLMYQPANPAEYFARGQEQGNALRLRQAMQQYGPGAIQGDQNALAGIAQYDPAYSMDLMNTQGQMRNRDRLTDSQINDSEERLKLAYENARRETEAHAAKMSAVEKEAAVKDIQMITALGGLQTPEEWDAAADQLELDQFIGKFDQRDSLMAMSKGVADALGGGESGETAEMRNLQFRAEQAGLTPGTPEYQNFMANGGMPRGTSLSVSPDGSVNFSDGALPGSSGIIPKAPSGFANVPGEGGVITQAPIEGGPGTQMPAELSARIGLADDSLKILPELIGRAEQGDLTGLWDWLVGIAGRGQQGADRRDISAASEAITRLLTGAGMNLAEARRESSLYMPGAFDNAEALTSKLTQLQRRLEATKAQAMKGRGNAVGIDPSTGMGVPNGAANAAEVPPEILQQLQGKPPGTVVRGPNNTVLEWDGSTLQPLVR